ncbi:MAG: TonB-dependent receptor [Sphingorhabdus sp.]
MVDIQVAENIKVLAIISKFDARCQKFVTGAIFGRGQIMKKEFYLASCAVMAWASLAAPAAAADAAPAQDTAASSDDVADGSEIIVTARRRNETALDTPVVLTAFSGEQLDRLGISNVTDVAKLTPMLVISPATGPFGGNLTLRGVASPSGNSSSEPAVTINIDGIPLTYGGVVRMGTMDIGQVEVLKGPQALFFGKNSTGGIVAIRTAEPTSTFSAKVSGGYEFNARQMDLDGYVSGPLSSTLTARLAGRLSRQRGYFTNVAPVRTIEHLPGTSEEGVRLSLNWEPTDRLLVKLRGTYNNVNENGSYTTSQKFACPTGVSRGLAALAGTDDCTANDTVVFAPFPGAAGMAVTGNPVFDSDEPYLHVRQSLLVSDISYALTDSLTVNSLTGYYRLRQKTLDSATSGARFFIGGFAGVAKNAFSQEVRLSYANPDSPFDFMIGGFYQDDDYVLDEQQLISFNGGATVNKLNENWHIPLFSKSYSAFAQAGFDVTEQFNVSAGMRYSQDEKRHRIIPPAPLLNKIAQTPHTFENWSPEITVSFKPNEDVNIFGSFKKGYKTGAFQASAITLQGQVANPAVTLFDPIYLPETAEGFEAGAKARLFDRQLRLNVAAYTYLYKDLQLSRLDAATLALIVSNASSARVKGIEGDFTFTPQGVPGLSIKGAAAYNSAKYASSFLSACYVGQTPAGGCTVDGPDADVIPDQQQFLGRPLPRAPKFSWSLGANYETPVGDTSNMTFNVNGIYTTSSFLSQELNPIGKSPKRFLLDGSVTFGSQSGSYEIALIGRNLTDKHYAFSGFQSPSTGSGTGTAAGILPDFEGPISRGREIWLRLTFRPSSF